MQNFKNTLYLVFLCAGLSCVGLGCQQAPEELPPTPVEPSRLDPHSWSNPEAAEVRHLKLDLKVDFEARILSGTASLQLVAPPMDGRLILDTQDLEISAVSLLDGTPLPFTLGEGNDALGQPLEIELPDNAEALRIDYRTSPSARALQWLTPEQTNGSYPFLFTQSQAILARSWVPCQDTPRVRMTYEATIQVPPPLLAVMSASNPTERATDGVYSFHMDQPIPSYLLALAVGDLEFQSTGERTGVYAEPAVLSKAAWELAETEAMVEAAEELYGPYAWDRYDVLFLPPSFPFGGMENPRLTFATPTILAGDRSLLALIAHELAHSWSGNLVTNATWNDLWINEGFTVYFERRIMEAIEGREYSEMLAQLGYQDLEAVVEELGATSPLTHLRLELGPEQDPDDVFSDIPYEKGYFLLRAIEETVGRQRFDEFLRSYFEKYAFQSIDTEEFLSTLRQDLVAGDASLESELLLDAWITGPGIPPNSPVVHSTAFEPVEAELARWTSGTAAKKLHTAGWNSHQWLHFLRHLPKPMSLEQMRDLDGAFSFTTTGNSELLNAWLLHGIANSYPPADPAVEGFLRSMGRRKFLQPLYTKLAETPEGLERARQIYQTARATYHPVAQATLDGILNP